MVALSTNKLLEMLRRSELIENDQLDRVIAELGPIAEADGPVLAEKLVAAKIITAWQRDQLLEGRYKGFFLVGKYKLLGLLGTGGMSSVYLAEHSKMQRLVAIKHLPKNRVNDSSYLARFYREAQAAAKLDHKNIVRAYDIDHEKDNHFLVMEYVEGRDLQTLVKEVGPLDFDMAADYIRQAADGLEHAHQAGLIHRDIKPANLLVDGRGVVRVLDMGLARWEKDDKLASLTIAHEENVLGTADYLAPEQARDSHSVDKRADIYSLGCTLYFLLTGHPPFPDGTLAQRIWKHQNQEPKSIYEERKDVPPPLVDVCLRMMTKQPDARFQSAGEVAQMLGKWLEARGKVDSGSSGLGITRRPVGPPPRRSSSSRSGAMPSLPPRRGERPGSDKTGAADDTLSNMNRETFKGTPSSTRSSPSSAGRSHVQPGGSAPGRSGGSVLGHGHGGGSSILGLGGSSVLGKAGAKGGSSKSLPVAKSLDGTKSGVGSSLGGASKVGHPNAPRDDSLSNLIEQAVEERKANSPRDPQQPTGSQPLRQLTADSPVPAWIWFALAGGVLLVSAVILGVLLIVPK